ncbi:MAG: hypothetical protein ACOVSW_18310 [Candidatus Kapaibacteriota bacterium]
MNVIQKLRYSLILFFILLGFAESSQAQMLQWQQINSTAGSVRCFAANSTALFAGAEGRGILRSTNNGETWVAVNTGLTNQFVYALLTVGERIFAGTQLGVFISEDNGATWNKAAINQSILSLSANSTTLFAGTLFGGIFRSTDGGVSWTASNSGFTTRTILSISASTDGSTVLIGTQFSNGIFRSIDNGQTWTKAENNDGGVYIQSIAMSSATSFIAVENFTGGNILSSTDKGAKWTVRAGFPNESALALVVRGETVFVGTRNKGVFRSNDNGETWIAANTNIANRTVYALFLNGSALFAGTNAGIWRVTNAITTNVHTREPSIAASIFPNPAIDEVAICFDLSSPQLVKLSIFNTQGVEINSLIKQEILNGRQCILWNTKFFLKRNSVIA